MRGGGDEDGSDLLVCEEFDGCVGKDTDQGGGVSAEEAGKAIGAVDVAHCCDGAKP